MAGDEGVYKSSEADGQPSGASAPVFVSYASHDVAIANAVVGNIEQHGIKSWIAPRDVTPGSQYADAIVGAINDAKVFKDGEAVVFPLAVVARVHAEKAELIKERLELESPDVGKLAWVCPSAMRRIRGILTNVGNARLGGCPRSINPAISRRRRNDYSPRVVGL